MSDSIEARLEAADREALAAGCIELPGERKLSAMLNVYRRALEAELLVNHELERDNKELRDLVREAFSNQSGKAWRIWQTRAAELLGE